MIPKDYVCDGQLNIWDYINEQTYTKLPSLDEVVKQVRFKCDILLEPRMNDIYEGWEWEHKWKHSKLSIHESHYKVNDCRRFIAVNWDSALSGRGIPCDSLEEVLCAVKSAIKAAEELENDKSRKNRKVVQDQ